MKRLCLPLLLCLCLLLSACSGGDAKDRYAQFSRDMNEKESLSFSSKLRAEYDDKSFEFVLRYEESGGEALVTVMEPELIRGVSARVKAGETQLQFEGVMLDTGELDEHGLSPMSALPLLVEAMRYAHADSFWTEDGNDFVKLIVDDDVSVQLCFKGSSSLPIKAEILSGGVRRVLCTIENWK